MREVIFRAKPLFDDIWLYGSLISLTNELGVYAYCITDGENTVRVEPSTIGEFTGMLDKNGVKIFEGDVIRLPGWVVTYENGRNEGLGMQAGWYYQRDDFESWCELIDDGTLVVLGNIHDNAMLRSSKTKLL